MNRLTKLRLAVIAVALAAAVTWTQPLSARQVDITVTTAISIGAAPPSTRPNRKNGCGTWN